MVGKKILRKKKRIIMIMLLPWLMVDMNKIIKPRKEDSYNNDMKINPLHAYSKSDKKKILK